MSSADAPTHAVDLSSTTDPIIADPAHQGLRRSVVFVGLMGAGKSSVGRRVARLAQTTFVDADAEITAAAGMSVSEIFALFGESAFRDLERRVVARLLDGGPAVLSLGGGAFIDPATRARVKAAAVSVWLRADIDTLLERTGRRKGSRPLLDAGEPRAVLEQLIRERYPVYAEADHTVDSGELPADAVAERVWALVAADVAAAPVELGSAPAGAA